MKNWGSGKMTMKKHFYRTLQPESVVRMKCARELTVSLFLTGVEKQLMVTSNGCIIILCLNVRHYGMHILSVYAPVWR